MMETRAERRPGSSSFTPVVNNILRAPGRPLDGVTRAFMEPRFGRDFSHVRVHADSEAAQSAAAVNAKAFTAGPHVVFGRGQYEPSSAGGRRLLAHELAHVSQQSASGSRTPAAKMDVSDPGDAAETRADRAASRVISGERVDPCDLRTAAPAIHRVPAAPEYRGVVGTIDMSKVRFTPIPDMTTGGLAAPLTLTPKLDDASLMHLTWILYDPSDTLIAGFSTLPGKANSKTEPFTLKPKWFAAGKPTGRYTVRLIGRNDKAEPVAYFDRFFHVHAKDLVTGTASTSASGDFTFTQYDKTDGDFAAGTSFVVDVKMKYQPKPSAITCDEIGFLQVAETSNPEGKSLAGAVGPKYKARATELNYSVDRVDTGPSPFYGTIKNAAGVIEPSGTNYKKGTGGKTPTAAELEDHPTWNKPSTDRFETCCACRKGSNAGQVYGCVTWGYTVDHAGKVALMPRGYSAGPSDTLKAALDKWNTWRTAQPTPADYEAAPALK